MTVVSFLSISGSICCISRTISDHLESWNKDLLGVGMFTRCITARTVKVVVVCVLQLGEIRCVHILWKFAIILWGSGKKLASTCALL